jgi:hypothetical protein
MRTLCFAIVACVLCSCGNITQTKDPAAAYHSTVVFRERDGTLQVVGDWTVVYASTTAEIPVSVAVGLKARVAKGKATYSLYKIVGKADRGGAAAAQMEDVTLHLSEEHYGRSTLDRAAAADGLLMKLPEWRTRHVFSAAYVRGVLQRADEILRNPASGRIEPISLPWQYER